MKRLIAFLLFCAFAIGASAAVQQRHTAVIQAKRAAGGGGPASPGTANLVAAWDFEDNLNDSGANALTLTASGTLSYVAGKAGQALVTEADEWATRGDNALLEPGAGSWSIAFWANFVDATPAALCGVVSKTAAAGSIRSWGVQQNTDGTTRLYISGDGSAVVTVSTTDSRADGTWFFCVATYVPSTRIRIYINGTLNNANTTSIPASIFNSTQVFNIASQTSSTSLEIPGTYDSVMLFNDELTDDEITWLYNAGNGRAASAL